MDGLSFIHSSLDDLGLDAATFRVYCRILRRCGGKPGVLCSEGSRSMALGCRMRRASILKEIEYLHEIGMITITPGIRGRRLIGLLMPFQWSELDTTENKSSGIPNGPDRSEPDTASGIPNEPSGGPNGIPKDSPSLSQSNKVNLLSVVAGGSKKSKPSPQETASSLTHLEKIQPEVERHVGKWANMPPEFFALDHKDRNAWLREHGYPVQEGYDPRQKPGPIL